jgi:hypothetical protein
MFEVRKARAEARQQRYEADSALREQIWNKIRSIEDLMSVEPEKDEWGRYAYTQRKLLDTPAFKGLVIYKESDNPGDKNPEYETGPESRIHILGEDEHGIFDFMYDDSGVWSDPMRYRHDESVLGTFDTIISGLQPQQPESQAQQPEEQPQPDSQEAA